MNKKILIVSDILHAGGAELVQQNICAELCERGEHVTLWAYHGTKEQLREKYPPGVRWRRWPFWRKPVKCYSPRHFVQKLLKILFEGLIIRLRKWDAVLAFKEGECMLLASKLRARRKVAMVHTDFGSFHWTGYCFDSNEAERRCMAGFDSVAIVSGAAKAGLVSAIGDPGNLRILLNPLDYRLMEQRAKEISPRRPQGKPLLVSVGRLSQVKRYAMLIDICAELSRSHPLELWIVGGGELEEELRQKLEREKIDCVRLLGRQDNPYPYIAAADWLISSSETESYGIAVQEALILGVPVIACACPAIAENMEESFGILCGMEKAELKAAIEKALGDKELAAQCRAAIAAGYDRQGLWEARLEKIYGFIVGE